LNIYINSKSGRNIYLELTAVDVCEFWLSLISRNPLQMHLENRLWHGGLLFYNKHYLNFHQSIVVG